MPTQDQIIEVLKKIEDPELFLDIWFLGLIYNIDIQVAGVIKITMTFTSPMCPAGPSLIDQIKTKIAELPDVSKVDVEVVFSPQWTPSDEVKAMLGMI